MLRVFAANQTNSVRVQKHNLVCKNNFKDFNKQ